MRRGLIEYAVLLIIAQGKVYAGDILELLKRADLIVVEGTLYPLLNRLKTQELLTYAWEESREGPPRKYYSLTDEGKRALKDFDGTWNHLVSSFTTLRSTYENNH